MTTLLLGSGEKRRNRVVVSMGGGAGTVLLAMRAIRDYGRDNVDIVQCRLPNESPEMWKLIAALENLTGIKVQFIGLNKEPFDVFDDVKLIGNTRQDPCSRVLKREYMQSFLEANYDKATTTILVGIHAYETSKTDRRIDIRRNYERNGWCIQFPLADDLTLTEEKQHELVETTLGFLPSMYKLGWPHFNCAGACVKAGKKYWAMLLYYFPRVYAHWERREKIWRARNGDYTVLRDEHSKNGKRWTDKLTLEAFRHRMQRQWAGRLIPAFDNLEDTPPCAYCSAI